MIAKPKCPDTVPNIKTVEDLHDELKDEDLFKRWRMVVDQSSVSKCMQDLNFPAPTPKTILSHFQLKRQFLALDISQAFYQVRLDVQSAEQFMSFCGPGDGTTYMLKSLSMGGKICMSALALILSLIYSDILLPILTSILFADNLVKFEQTIDELLESFEKILARSRLFNVCLKPSDVIFGISISEDEKAPIELLGLEIYQAKIHVPRRRKIALTDSSKF